MICIDGPGVRCNDPVYKPINTLPCIPGPGNRCDTVTTNNGCAGTKYNTNTGALCVNQTLPKPTRTLKIGVPKSIEVQQLQSALGIKADGIYGQGTAAKVKEWQQLQGLPADGAFGPKSYQTLLEQTSL